MTVGANPREEDLDRAPIRADGPLEAISLPLRRSPLLLLGCLVVGAVGGLALGIVRPNEFASRGKLLVRLGEREQQTADTALHEQPLGPRTAYEDVENEVHILSSREVLERVALEVGPEEILRPPDFGSPEEPETTVPARLLHRLQSWWFRRSAPARSCACGRGDCPDCLSLATRVLADNALVAPEQGSSVISIKYTASSPQTARRVVEAYLAIAKEQHLEVFGTKGSFAFLQKQAEEESRALVDADSTLAAYRMECGTYDLDGQRATLLRAEREIKDGIAADEERLEVLKAQRGALERAIADEKPSEEHPMGPVRVPNPDRGTLLGALFAAQTERVALRRKFREGSEEVRGKDDQIRQLREELEKLPPFLEQGESVQVVKNEVYGGVRERLVAVEQEAAGIEAGLAKRRARLDGLRGDLLMLQQCQPRLIELERAAQLRRESSSQVASALERFGVAHALDLGGVSNLRVIEEATRPWTKAGPDRRKYLVLGAGLGLAAGFALAFLRQTSDRRIRLPRDVGDALGVPLLGVVGRTRRWKPRAVVPRPARREAG